MQRNEWSLVKFLISQSIVSNNWKTSAVERSETGVYSNTNWPPFTGGQNSILNLVLKLNPLNQKIKK